MEVDALSRGLLNSELMAVCWGRGGRDMGRGVDDGWYFYCRSDARSNGQVSMCAVQGGSGLRKSVEQRLSGDCIVEDQ